MNRLFVLTLVMICSSVASANIQLPKIFGDNMVLQRGMPIPVWGRAEPGEKITVRFNNTSQKVTTGTDGKWMVRIPEQKAGGPYVLTVQGTNTITFNNVLVGEVWLCSGQSNMEWNVKSVINAEKEIESANYPLIRHIEIPKSIALKPQEDITGNNKWESATPENVGDFTAVGYFFAREIFQELNVPIGLIHSSWGGTHSETWTSKDAFEKDPEFKEMIASMPSLDLDSLATQQSDKMLARINQLQNGLPPAATVNSFKETGYDDQKWPVMIVPGVWENQQLPDVDGVVWFRKQIELSDADAGKEAVLELAMIDDRDETFVNGVNQGSTAGYNIKRSYKIAAGVLKPGKNVIAIKITDTGGGGGIYGESSAVKLTIGEKTIPLAGDWQFQVESVSRNASSIGPNAYPTLLFNAMINPLIPFGIKGALWYQGESNAGRAFQYRKAFPLMISDWRKHWKEGTFPFYFVQLASFNADNGNSTKGSSWAELREAQTLTLSLPNTGMAVTTDIGESGDIHPRNKQDVGKRLAAVALHNTYNKKIVYSGPIYVDHTISGDKIRLNFKNTGTGLMTKNVSGELKGFEIAGSDKQFKPGKAVIEGDHVIVTGEGLANPVAVRFGWEDDAGDTNLFNKEGFPASPFRTDSWKGVTETNKFSIAK
jgi:sialate O-acetylesterase